MVAADEDVLHDGLELARPLSRDDDAPPVGPPPEGRHGELAADQQDADPERDAPPDRDVVEIVPLPRDPVDRDQGGEEQQLVGDRIEQLPRSVTWLRCAGQPPVDDVGHGGREEDRPSEMSLGQ